MLLCASNIIQFHFRHKGKMAFSMSSCLHPTTPHIRIEKYNEIIEIYFLINPFTTKWKFGVLFAQNLLKNNPLYSLHSSPDMFRRPTTTFIESLTIVFLFPFYLSSFHLLLVLSPFFSLSLSRILMPLLTDQ